MAGDDTPIQDSAGQHGTGQHGAGQGNAAQHEAWQVIAGIDDQAAFARRLYGRLLDPHATESDDTLELPDTSLGVGEVSDLLNDRFARRPAPTAIMLKVGGRQVGVSTLGTVNGAAGYAGPDFGAAERSELPGKSTRYKRIVFECTTAGCGDKFYGSYYDERVVPECPRPGHGPMKLAEPVR